MLLIFIFHTWNLVGNSLVHMLQYLYTNTHDVCDEGRTKPLPLTPLCNICTVVHSNTLVVDVPIRRQMLEFYVVHTLFNHAWQEEAGFASVFLRPFSLTHHMCFFVLRHVCTGLLKNQTFWIKPIDTWVKTYWSQVKLHMVFSWWREQYGAV